MRRNARRSSLRRLGVLFSEAANPIALHGEQVGEHEAISFDRFAGAHVDRLREHRTVRRERVELAALAARIHVRG